MKAVFSKPVNIILAVAISTGLFVGLSLVSEYIFISPLLVLNLNSGNFLGFVLIVAISIMSGLVLSMNVYRIRVLRNNSKTMGTGVLGSIIGASAGACSCGSIGFAAISVFGTAGGIATSFLTNYELPLRLGSLAILGYTFYTTKKSLHSECKIKN
ncbi:MAG: hypothetical protein LV477_00890 [Candidatus Nitrosotalea sp.]|nr:hypothetical protein [Candidatus Nitrosotalea sp.]